MTKQTELPELPLDEGLEGLYTADQMREYALAALAAVKGEGEAVAYTTKCRLDLLKLKPEKAQTMWSEELLDEGDVPLYLHHLAENPIYFKRLAKTVDRWNEISAEEYQKYSQFENSHLWEFRVLYGGDAIRAAMKERAGS